MLKNTFDSEQIYNQNRLLEVSTKIDLNSFLSLANLVSALSLNQNQNDINDI